MITTLTAPSAGTEPIHFHAKPKPVADAGSTNPWSVDDVAALFDLPFSELIHRAQTVHREQFDPTEVELATLLSVKTGGCPEDCGYCPQSVHFDTGLEAGKLMGVAAVREAAQRAKQAGATRFCMGAAWRAPKDRDVDAVTELVRAVKEEGLEACATLGMLNGAHAEPRRAAGLDYYTHTLDSVAQGFGMALIEHTQ